MNVKEYAKKLSSLGFSIIPVAEDKKPIGKWKEYQTKCRTSDEIEQLNSPLFGLVTGVNDLEVVDVDLKVLATLQDRREWFEEYIKILSDNIDDFPKKFVVAKTRNNGYHILYKSKVIDGNSKIAKLKDQKECILESRGVGGMVVLYSDFLYELNYNDIDYVSDEERNILWTISKMYNYTGDAPLDIPKIKVETKENELTPWDDFNAQHTSLDVVADGFRIVGNLSDKYIIKRHGATSAHSGYVYKNSGCMYLFSTGTEYPSEKLLSPFACYSYKHHNGDFKEASKDLYKQGFGSRIVKQLNSIPKIEIEKKSLVFPIDVFPENIQHYILESERTLGLSIDYMGCSMLWLLSVIIGNSTVIEVKRGWWENCTVWISLVGKAGIGKTPSISQMIQPLMKANNKQIKDYIKNYQKYLEFMELDKKEREFSEEISKPKKSQFIVNDITLEALVDMHEENKNAVGVFKDELAGWFKDMNKYRAGSDLEFWLSSWSGKSVSLNRKTAKSSFVEKPFIPVLGGIQPSIFDQFQSEENKENGFSDRMLISFPELYVPEYNVNQMNEEVITWYDDFVVSFYDKVKRVIVKFNTEEEIEPIVAQMLTPANEEWIRIFNKISALQNSDEENEYMKSMLPKQKSYIPRFALMINCLWCYHDDKTNWEWVTKESILRAEKLSDYFINMAKKVKVESLDKQTIKRSMDKSKSSYEQFEQLYKLDKELNRTTVSELLGVSRTTLNNWIKKIDKL